MKLLFDQNISFRIVSKIKKILPDATQVRLVGLENSNDREIWEYAKLNKYTILTFDGDFYEISLFKGIPPKIIWLRLGNTTTNNLALSIIKNINTIKEFVEHGDYSNLGCLEIID